MPDDEALTLAVNNLHLDEAEQKQEWLISAPGKIILFGEHAVVHGVVSLISLSSTQGQVRTGYGNEWNDPSPPGSTVPVFNITWPQAGEEMEDIMLTSFLS